MNEDKKSDLKRTHCLSVVVLATDEKKAKSDLKAHVLICKRLNCKRRYLLKKLSFRKTNPML